MIPGTAQETAAYTLARMNSVLNGWGVAITNDARDNLRRAERRAMVLVVLA